MNLVNNNGQFQVRMANLIKRFQIEHPINTVFMDYTPPY